MKNENEKIGHYKACETCVGYVGLGDASVVDYTYCSETERDEYTTEVDATLGAIMRDEHGPSAYVLEGAVDDEDEDIYDCAFCSATSFSRTRYVQITDLK